MKFSRVDQVCSWRLCMGCGACVSMCTHSAISLVDIEDLGLRPIVDLKKCEKCGKCVNVCPGAKIKSAPANSESIPELRCAWGQVLEVWEGYASGAEIRFRGSSGGAATAIALFCLEKEHMTGALHIGANPESPLQNVPVFSKSREDLLACAGSRYSPAAPCEKMGWIREPDSHCVFIGKPCDVVALRKAAIVDPLLEDKVALSISIFCAGTPSSKGTEDLLTILGVKRDEVEEIRYRGCGWPGMTTVKIKGDNSQTRRMTYEQSWGDILSNYGQFRCRVCPDSTGELADISCGDPWHREIEPDDSGRSLVLVRTERGREILHKAMKEGYIQLDRVEPDTLPQSQRALLRRRRHLWGRLLAMRIMGVPTPQFEGFSLYSNWRCLSLIEKIRSVLGTFRRIISRRWNKPLRDNSQWSRNSK